jgi:hypothetical protein
MRNRARPGAAFSFIKVLVVFALVATLTAGCGRHVRPQSQAFDEQSRITLVDAWILQHTPELLQVLLTYEGVDPNQTYNLRASLRADQQGFGWGGGWIKQMPVPSGKVANRSQVIWEFLGFPKDSANIYLQLEGKDKVTCMSRSVEFKLPGTKQLRVRKMGSQ